MKLLSQILLEIDALSAAIQKEQPELYQNLIQNPIPCPQEFKERNDPQGLENYLEAVKMQLTQLLQTPESHELRNQ